MLTRRHITMAAAATTGFLGLAAMACAGPLAAEQVDGRFERTLSVPSPVDLNISTGSGSIDIRPGGAGTIHVVGLIHVGRGWSRRSDTDVMSRVHDIEQNPPIEQSGGHVTI